MPYLVGLGLAVAVCGLATLVRLDRDRAFYPIVMIVIASYYVLFAVMGGSTSALVLDTVIAAGFTVASVVSFKRNLWILVGLLCAHGVLDLFHAELVSNPGVPPWWPPFCLAYDVTAGLYLAWLLTRSASGAAPVKGIESGSMGGSS